MSGSRKVGPDADHDWIYDIIGYLIKLCVIWTTSQVKKNSGPLNDTFDFIPPHLTFQADVVNASHIHILPKILFGKKWCSIKCSASYLGSGNLDF